MLPWLLLNTITRVRWMKFAGLNRALRASQEAMLLRMVADAADTAFGRAHGFAGIRTRADFQKPGADRDMGRFRALYRPRRGGRAGRADQ